MVRATGQDRLDSMRARMARKVAEHKAKMETEMQMQMQMEMEKLSLERARAVQKHRSMKRKLRRKNKSKQDAAIEHSDSEPTPLDDSFYLNIEQRAGCLRYSLGGRLCLNLMDPHKEFYLIPSLSSKPNYYQHLVVNNMSTRKHNYSSTWSRDLVTDRQYVRFYSKLKDCIIDKVPSWIEHVSGCLTSNKAKQKTFLSNRRVYVKEALRIAKSTEFSKLNKTDVFLCILEVIKENSLVLERLKFSEEFHLCLLNCGYGEEEISDEYLSWEKREDHPLHNEFEMRDYKNWLDQPGIRQMNKCEKETELRKYHELKSKEDCSTRIRYLKLKLELAENLGLISKEAGTIQ